MISGGRPDSVGGRVVADIFSDLRRPTRFGGGGGVVAEIFRDLQRPTRFSGGGGGSSRNFSGIAVSQPLSVGERVVGIFLGFLGRDQSNYLNSGSFFF